MIGSGVLVADPNASGPAALSWRLCRVLLVLWFNADLGASSPRAGCGSRHTSEDVLFPPGLRCLANAYGQNPVLCGKTQSPNGKYVLDANRSHQRISATA